MEQHPLLLPAPLANQDTLNRILEFLGPRHTILSIGSINKSLRQLSQHDSLWKIFWLERCCLTNYDDESSSGSYCSIGNLDELLCQPDDSQHNNNNDNGGNSRAVRRVHRAALTFRHAIHSLGFQSRFLASHHDDYESTDNNNDDDNDTLKSTSLYEGYIQTHTMMKLTNLRAKTLHDNSSSPLLQQLSKQSCTQTWPGQLSLVQNNHHNNNNDEVIHNTVVTCLNSAEVWCDHPSCKHARCGPNGVCLRAYRFLPSLSLSSSVVGQQRDVRRTNVGDLNGPGDINGTWRQQQQHAHAHTTTTNDWNTNLSFVKCNWCSVSYCNEHIENRGWYKCDECELSSCLQCTSQVFSSTTTMMLYYPPIQICNVMTAGKKCGRRVCSNCTWFVGKECSSSSSSSQQEERSVIPGGKVITDYNVVSIKAGGDDTNNDEQSSCVSNRERIQQLIEKEMCCSKCLRHVEFRWRELSVVIDMFDGFVP